MEALSTNEIADTFEFAKNLSISHADLDKNLKSLNADDYVVLQVIERKITKFSF